MTLRFLQTLVEIGVENNTTTVFPIPIDLFQTFLADRPEKLIKGGGD